MDETLRHMGYAGFNLQFHVGFEGRHRRRKLSCRQGAIPILIACLDQPGEEPALTLYGLFQSEFAVPVHIEPGEHAPQVWPRLLWDALGLKGKLMLQSELGVSGRATDLLISICTALNADTYLAQPFVEKFLDTDKLRAGGVALASARFSPPVYPQLWGEFRYNLTFRHAR